MHFGCAFLTVTPGRANECSNYTWQLHCGRKEFFGVQNGESAHLATNMEMKGNAG